jgi:hypothetical protein
MARKIIELRGHHISYLAEKYDDSTWAKDISPFLSTHVNQFDSYGNLRFLKQLNLLTERIFTGSSALVKIVEGKDNICSFCPEREECSPTKPGQKNFGDEASLEGFNLSVGRVYSVGELIEKFRDYKERTGIASPRETPQTH